MGRVLRDAKLSTRSARLGLASRPAPYYRLLDPGLHLGYRRLRGGPGTWLTRRRIGKAYVVENLRTRDDRLVLADDYADADGAGVLTFQQAQAAARALVAPVKGGDKLETVLAAVESYRADIVARGGDITNADRVLLHLPETFGQKIVARLLVRDFRDWTDNLNAAELKAATVDRINSCMRAALNLAATNDERITERPWRKAIGGKSGPGGEVTANNVHLNPQEIAGIVRAAYRIDDYFGRFCEVAAETGARASQIERLRVCDLDFEQRQLSMPTSFKGKRDRQIEHRPLLIPDGLAIRLRDASKGRKSTDMLLPRPDGKPFSIRSCALGDHFVAALKSYDPQLIERDGVKITMYALRHSSIIRGLLANISVRIVARCHDTSLKYLERNYSRYIDRHADDVRRPALLDLDPTPPAPAKNVVALPRRSVIAP